MRSAFFSLLILSCAVMACGQVNPHTQIRWPGSCTTAGTVYNVQSNTCVALSGIGGQLTPNTQVNWPGSCTAAGTVYNVQSNTCVALSGIGGQLTPNTQVNWPGSCTAAGTVYSLQSNTCVALSGMGGQVTPSTQINWPANCNAAGMVYSSQANACVSTGAAGNPGGTSGQGQMNLGGVFAPIPGLVVDGINGWNIAGGTRYAKGWQTGGGNNGIANASAANQVVVADPTYGLTDKMSPTTLPAASNMHFLDLRQGQEIEVYHNPTTAPTFNYNRFGNASWSAKQTNCYYDTIAPAWTFTSNSVTLGCTLMTNEYNAPGWTYGEGAVVSGGANGWVSIGSLSISNTVRTKGIYETLGLSSHKYATGDNVPGLYIYGYGSGGSVSPADESNKALAIHMDEETDQFIANCSTGCTTGSTSVLTNVPNRAQGPGRLIFDSTKGASATGHFTSVAAGLGGASAVTVDATVPVSTAWGSIAAIATPVTPAPPFTSSQTFNVTVASGTFAVGGFVCFSGNFHEQSIISAVTNGAGPTASITVPLRGPHAAGTYIFQGGMCGNGFEVATLTYNNLKYLFDVVGSTTANTLQVVKFAYGTGGAATIPTYLWQTFPVAANLTTAGAAVYGTTSGASNIGNPNGYTGQTITIAGMSDSALNANCTNLLWTSASNFQCSIAGLTGTHTTSTSGTATFYNANSFNTYQVAEVTDVQNETLTPPQVDGTLALEPNNIQFATNDSIVETHYPSSAWQAATASTAPQNPYTVATVGASFALAGKGAQGGGGSLTSNAALSLGVGDSSSTTYADGGGFLSPANGIQLTGTYLYGLNTSYPSNNGAVLNINANATGNAHRNHQYSIWNNLFRIGGAFFAKAYPYYGDVDLFNTGRTLSISGNPLNINSGLNFLQVYDQIRFMATGTPGTPTVTCSPTGGTLANGTYYYKVAIITNVTTSLPSAEASGTVTGGSGNGSCAIDAVAKVGATLYRFYGRTTGAEQQLSFTSGINSTYFVDTGTLTPSGAPVVTDTTLGWIDQAAKLCVNSSTTAFESCLVAPSGAAASYTLNLPASGSTSTLVDEPSGATVVGNIATYNTSTGQIHDSGTALSSTPKAVTCGTTTTCSNTAQASPRIVHGNVALTAGSAVVASMTAWTATTSFDCTGTDKTAAAAVQIVNTSTTSITITGTGTDVIAYVCVGN